MAFNHCFLTTGIGNHPEKLISFELALRNAGAKPQGIAPYNWIFVNSILPAKCHLVSKEEGLELLTLKQEFGDPAYMVLSKAQTKQPHQTAYASIGASQYARKEGFGYLAEYSLLDGTAETEYTRNNVRDTVTNYSRFMLHTLVGEMEIDWNSLERDFAEIEASLPTITESVVISNSVKSKGIFPEWATAIACAILIPG